MKNYIIFSLSAFFLIGCSDVEFTDFESTAAAYSLELVTRTSALANGTGKALLQFRILSDEGKPIEGIYFSPENSASQITSQSCTTSDKNGLIYCSYTALTSGQFVTSLKRGEQVTEYQVTFLPITNSHLSTKTTPSSYIKQEVSGYQIKSAVSGSTTNESNEFGYTIKTNVIF